MLCDLMRCPYEDDDEVQCEWCSHNYWEESDFEDSDDFEDFDELFDFDDL